MPIIAGASLVLTEMPAALLVTYSVYTLMGGTIGKRNLLFFSAIAFLPWLHLKLIILPPVFYICYYCFLFRNKKFNLKTELMNNFPVLLSVSLYLWFYYAAYGVIAPFGVKELHENIYASDPSLQQNKFVITPIHFIISGLAALFDRDYGLIPYCLLYITAIWGIMLAVRKKQSSMFIPLLLCAPYALIFLMWKDWTGSMTPARQLLPVIFVFIFYAVYFLDSTVFIKTKFFKVLLIISFFVSWLLTAVPSLRYGASKDKIYNFLSSHAPRQLFWVVPPFRDNITAGTAESLIYLAIIIISYYYILNKRKA
jgi:hypothetical protein